tara:strand:- start:1903 stop:2883 length:981 start_codon:yes stop_codon:yes gene_type:complete
MSETKNWRSTRSYGVILARYNQHLNIPEYLMVCRKSTYCYVDFILGKYDDKNTDYLKFMVKNMTYSERISISTKNFEDLWKDLYYNSRAPNGAFYDYVSSKFYKVRDCFIQFNTSLSCIYKWPEWGFPKGRPNQSEDPFDCARRELYEETRISQNNYNILTDIMPFEEKYVGTNGHSYRNVFFIGQAHKDCNGHLDKTNTAQAREIGFIKWFKYEDAIKQFRDHEESKRAILNSVHNSVSKYFENTTNHVAHEALVRDIERRTHVQIPRVTAVQPPPPVQIPPPPVQIPPPPVQAPPQIASTDSSAPDAGGAPRRPIKICHNMLNF